MIEILNQVPKEVAGTTERYKGDIDARSQKRYLELLQASTYY
jgi:hypothetical protein